MDKKLFLSLLFTAAGAITTGVFFEVFMTGSGKGQLLDLLSSYLQADSSLPFLQTFMQDMGRELLWFLTCFSMAFLPFGLLFIMIPAAVFLLLLKGFAAGFSSAMVLEALGLSGIPHLLFCLLPFSLVQIFLFAWLFGLSVSESCGCRGNMLQNLKHGKKRTAPQSAKQYLYNYALGMGILILSSLLHTVFLPAVT